MHTLSINCQLHYRVINVTQFIFQLQIAEHPWQTIIDESFQLKPDLTFEQYHRDNALNRLIRVYAPEGDLIVHYNAEVQTDIPERDTTLKECEIKDLPSDTLFYLAPSRFCESDLIGIMVNNTFADLPKGYTRVQAICDWIYNNILYQSGSSDSTTTARDILVNRAGVCRDFAHLGIAICRALNIPARFVFGYMPFYEAQPDFHAIFEVYLENQWVLFDATRMGPIDQFVRIGTGLDAKDVPFATVYGEIELISMSPLIERVGA
ncbi:MULTISPECIES: transglutaminase-like domain-containing protein [Acinetobacter]|uniref:transglutaminase-like domain-containing protein n=1 Tax=Acinetobacter TaxID=469 RepID=UPI0004483818|nr:MULTISPECIES: transglutaminase family protein [Acinetobacter]EXD36762.1 transglutaminase-like enzyme, putative cysteine protease [Acinetobacter sp. 479375]